LAAQFEAALPNGHQRHIATTFLASIRQLNGIVAAAGLDEDKARDRADLAVDRLLPTSLADDAGHGATTVHTLCPARGGSPMDHLTRSRDGARTRYARAGEANDPGR